ncbi:hypothetical protein AJ80_07260 [Polytolypa hystricis UAMH7299]|uniref:Flavin-nucleotide-binding protein n=1 Tax=Polytolypa hystricis (strain UAMH7299) TaxID=1447883 RepID=A0A2B7XRC5_POLH7|nr:hypothetical protein AJ80_07260 [Polytolypa hystricis UAMH7299]
MGKTLVYPKTSSNTVNRYKDRATYDLGPIHSIINSSPVLHVSFSPDPNDPFPAILPMLGQMGSFEYPSADINEPLDCYLHGYVSSRIINLSRSSDSEGLPVCIAATKIDGFVLTLTPNSHSYNYRSAVLHGYATLVTDAQEKMYAMKLMTDSVIPNRWDNTRVPPDNAEMSSTSILRVKIVDGSRKNRTGGPSDEKKDTQRSELTENIWTGVVPVYETFGEPIPSPSNKVKEVPEHIRSYVDSTNESNRAYAENVAVNKLPSKSDTN